MSVNITLDHGTTFTQWDKGRYIYITGYTSSDDIKVHFTTGSSGVAFTVLPVWESNKWKAGVPNTVLTDGLPVNIYIYDESLTENRTVYKFVVGVEQRPKPADYIYDAYERNTLQWPYEENIEDILRSSTIIFESEDERVAAENQRRSDELVRISHEDTRESNENTRIANENLRNQKLADLEDDLESVEDLQREIVNARGTYQTLGERLAVYGLDKIVSSVTIDSNHNIKVKLLDGRESIIGQLDTAQAYIVDLERTGGTGAAGSTDQYTITMNDGTTYTFNVYNGSNGATFIPSMSQDGTLSWTNNGGLQNPAPMNLRGPSGVTFTPHIDSNYNLSWTNNGGLQNPETVNIKGPSGEVAYMYTPHVSSEGVLSWSNDGGQPNPDPVNLKGANGSNGVTYTPSVSVEGVLSWSNNGGLPNPQDRSIKGADGVNGTTFTPSVDDNGNLSWSNTDSKPNPATKNIKGPRGSQGVTFTPSVSAEGVISWSNDGGLANPQSINIKGEKGDPGSGGDADTLQSHPASYFATSNHTHSPATQSANGFMTAADKSILDTMTGSGANAAQNVGMNSSPTFNIVTATKLIGAVYA